jgi:hypothetical protein
LNYPIIKIIGIYLNSRRQIESALDFGSRTYSQSLLNHIFYRCTHKINLFFQYDSNLRINLTHNE